ncbi:hypothetical protein [Streptomyces sp. NBC_01508]
MSRVLVSEAEHGHQARPSRAITVIPVGGLLPGDGQKQVNDVVIG